MAPDAYDLLVVGGGINGAGIAWELARRDYEVVLFVDKSVAGSGTSSRTTKMIRGGLRYLERLRVVRDGNVINVFGGKLTTFTALARKAALRADNDFGRPRTAREPVFFIESAP